MAKGFNLAVIIHLLILTGLFDVHREVQCNICL